MTKYRFDEIAINSTAKKKPVEADKETYIGLEHIDAGSLEITRFGSDVAPIGEKLLMKKGDVLFGKRRAYQKKVAIAPFDGIFSAHGLVLRPKEDVVDKDFFPLFISSDYFLDAAIKISVGSLSPTINWSDLKELEFELPPLEEQRKLAKILWAGERTRQAYKKLLQKCDDLIKAKFVEIFGGDGLYSKSPIKDFVTTELKKAKTMFRKEDVIKYVEISSLDIERENINYSEIKLGEAPVSAQLVLEKGDILISKVRPNLQKNMINSLDYKNLIGTNGFVVLRSTEYPVEFLWANICSKNFVSKMVDSATGSTYPTIKDDDVLNYLIPHPPKNKAIEFAEFYKIVDTNKKLLMRAENDVNELKRSLIRQCLTQGE